MSTQVPKGEEIITSIFSNLKRKNLKKFIKMSDKEYLDYLKQELTKLGLFVNTNSQEYQSFNNLKQLNSQLNLYLDEVIKQINYSNNKQTLQISRISYNIDNIVKLYLKIDALLKQYRLQLKPFESLLSKYVKKIPKSKSKSRSQSLNNSKTRKNKTKKQTSK